MSYEMIFIKLALKYAPCVQRIADFLFVLSCLHPFLPPCFFFLKNIYLWFSVITKKTFHKSINGNSVILNLDFSPPLSAVP